MNRKPTFIGIGAAKGGTTTLYDILKQHPQIHLPSFKEVHFFDYAKNYAKGYSWYEDIIFSGIISGISVVGEITPCYMFAPLAAERIYETVGPDVKIIVILRHPSDRAYSHYNMLKARGLESLEFGEAIEEEEERLKISERDFFRYSYIGRGKYYQQLISFFSKFPRENIKILIFEEFLADKSRYVAELLKFLNVDEEFLNYMNLEIRSNDAGISRIKFLDKIIYSDTVKKIARGFLNSDKFRSNIKRKIKFWNRKAGVSKKLDLNLKKRLFANYFEEDVLKLEELLGRNLDIWRH